MWRRSAILSASPGSRGGCRARSRSLPSRGVAAPSERAAKRAPTRLRRCAAMRSSTRCLHQAGVLRFHSGEAMFDAAQLFESQPLPSGRRIGIVSNSAGVATLAADACATRGLEVREASDAQYPAGLGGRRRTGRIRREHPRAARRRRHRCADGLLRRPSRRRPGGRAGGDLRGLGGAAQAGCGIRRALGRPAAREERLGRAELPVPRVVCRRARARGRTSRMAVAAARRGPALLRPERDGGARADLFIS